MMNVLNIRLKLDEMSYVVDLVAVMRAGYKFLCICILYRQLMNFREG